MQSGKRKERKKEAKHPEGFEPIRSAAKILNFMPSTNALTKKLTYLTKRGKLASISYLVIILWFWEAPQLGVPALGGPLPVWGSSESALRPECQKATLS